jgi:hypothetical protein
MMSTRIEPGEKLDDETVAAANARLAAKGIGPSTAKAAEEGGVGPHNIIAVLQEMAQPQTGIAAALMPIGDQDIPAPETPATTLTEPSPPESGRKPRSDKGTKRGPIVSKEPEAAAIEGTIVVSLTAVQVDDLDATAGKLLASVGLQPHHLTVSPAEWLLNACVQKHWRTLIGK